MRRAATLLLRNCKNQHLFKPCLVKTTHQRLFISSLYNSASISITHFTIPFQVRSVSDKVESYVSGGGFDEMASGTHRRFYMLGGKGGVGKTSCAASLALRFANNGHPTMVVSTDPAHSLSDSFGQDLSGGDLVPVQGVDSPLFALEINVQKSIEEFRAATKGKNGNEIRDFMSNLGLRMIGDQLGDLKLGDLLDNLLLGFDEAIAIYKVMEFVQSQQYSMFTRIVFDTAPTGHTLRLLSMPSSMDTSIGKMMKFKTKLASAASALNSLFGKQELPQNSSESNESLEQLKEKMEKVRDLFHDPVATEFIIVTIPTVMAISESSRLRASLRKENVSVQRLVVNQIIPQSVTGCKFCSMRWKDQRRAIEMIQSDPELSHLSLVESPLVDAEIRGVPALKYMGDLVWK